MQRYERIKRYRTEAIIYQNNCCWWCDNKLDERIKRTSPSADHVLATALGGRTDRFNIVVTHHNCNLARGISFRSDDTKHKPKWYAETIDRNNIELMRFIKQQKNNKSFFEKFLSKVSGK